MKRILKTSKPCIITLSLVLLVIFPFSNLNSLEKTADLSGLAGSSAENTYNNGWRFAQNDIFGKKSSKIKETAKKTKKTRKKKKTKKKKKKTKYFTLNFKDVQMSEFLNVMSQLIGKNIIINDKIRGKITISSAKKIPVSQAYRIMKTILEVKGLAVVESGHLIKVIPVKEAIKKNVDIMIDGKALELPPADEKTMTYLLKIEHADANEISSVLKSIKSKFTDIVVYSALNTLIFSGTSTEINGLIEIAKALDEKIEEGDEPTIAKGNIHVVHLENADAEQLAGVLSRIPFSETAKISKQRPAPKVRKSKKGKRITKTQITNRRKQSQTKLSIISNKETNSLIIAATPDEFKMIKRIIKELDVVREQVLIEALIIEVSAETGLGLGVDWMLGSQNKRGSKTDLYGGSSILGMPPSFSTEGVGGLGDKKIPLPLSTGFQIGFLSGEEVLGFALLSLSQTDKHFNVLSTPQILTIDNNEAELNIGEDIPVTTNTRVTDSGMQVSNFEYKSVGVKLKITPHITNKNRITLDLYQEVNSVLGQTTVLETGTVIPPKLGKRDISTKVTVGDGKTIVVGGLIRNDKVKEETKVPILGDIPILGWLFKRRSMEYRKTNLMVFITPHIVTKQETSDAVTRRKKEEQQRLRFR